MISCMNKDEFLIQISYTQNQTILSIMERYTKPKGVTAAMAKVGSAYLHPPLNRFMISRPALQFSPPIDRQDTERIGPILDSFRSYMNLIKKYKENSLGNDCNINKSNENEISGISHSKSEKKQTAQSKLLKDIQNWDPHNMENVTHDPFKTLFIGRLSFSLSEKHLKREFENYGRIRQVHLIKDRNEKSRGYAFVEFEHERDMIDAYRQADGMKIAGKRIIVDVERGRTVKGWRPRRLGGGLGQTRMGSSHQNDCTSGRVRESELESISRKLDQHSHYRRDERDRYKRHREYSNESHHEYDDKIHRNTRIKRSRSPIEEGEMVQGSAPEVDFYER